MFPTVAAKIFGIQYGGQIYTIMFFFIAASSILGFLIVEFAKSVSHQAMFFIAAAFTAFNILLLYYFIDEEMISKATIKRLTYENRRQSIKNSMNFEDTYE